MNKKRIYKKNIIGQVCRKRAKHGKANRPRLRKLKEVFGCYVCGRSDIPGEYLDGHHLYGKDHKHKALSHLCNGPWGKVVDEILGIPRNGPSGGPVVMVCQRYHEDEIKYGKCAKPCTYPCFKNVSEPYRVKTRLPGRIRSHVEEDKLGEGMRDEDQQAPTQQSNKRWWVRQLGKLKNELTKKFNRNA